MVPDRFVISKLEVGSAMTEPVIVVSNNPIIIAITHVVFLFSLGLRHLFPFSYDMRHTFKLFQTTSKLFNVLYVKKKLGTTTKTHESPVSKIRRIWCENCRVVQMQFKQTNSKWE